MRRLLTILLIALTLTSLASAKTGWTDVTASAIVNQAGDPITGKVYFLATDDYDKPLPGFRPGGGGQVIKSATWCTLTAGAIVPPCAVPDSSQTIPINVKYRVVVVSSSGTLYYKAIAISGATFSLDSDLVPTNPPEGFSAALLTVAKMHFLDGSYLTTGNPEAVMSGINIDSPDVSLSGRYSFKVSKDLTLDNVSCSTTAGSTVTIQLQVRVDPNALGTNMLTSSLVCDASNPPPSTTSFSQAKIDSGSYLTVMVVSTSGVPEVVRIFPHF